MKPNILRISLLFIFCLGGVLSGCTKQTPHSFGFMPLIDSFQAALEVNTRVDLLWVVDNSASMDVSQDRLRRGFTSFADKYLKSNWDIRMAVITTDTYMADPVFNAYLQSVIPGTIGWDSPYISSRLDTFVNPSWNPDLVNLKTGVFTHGITRGDQVPAWGENYAKLIPGIHDGPIAGLCTEAHSYFFLGASKCWIRDDQTRYTGTSHCLNPPAGETAITQCVNTVQNDTVHSGRAILSTQSPESGDTAWISEVIKDFMINSSTGSSGSGSERGFASVLQLLKDNEGTATALFRKGSTRVIVFLADEDDQTLETPNPLPSGFGPFSNYSSNCPPKTVDDYTYTLSTCPDPTRLVSVESIKLSLDQFFRELDGDINGDPKYFVTSIVPLTGESIQKLQQARQEEDLVVGNPNVAVDRGDRYIELSNLVGGGSFVADVSNDDYSPILDYIGRAMIQQRSAFTLSEAPGPLEDLVLTIVRSDGTSSVIPKLSYSVSGTTVTITDFDLLLSLTSSDRITISYIPKTIS